MKKIYWLISMAVAGCATSSPIYTSDGTSGYNITCSGTALTWGHCYKEAGKICGKKGYEILEKSGDQGSVVSGNQFGVYGGSIINRNMVIRCKES